MEQENRSKQFYNQWWFWVIAFGSLVLVTSIIFIDTGDQASGNNSEVLFDEDSNALEDSNEDEIDGVEITNEDIIEHGITVNETVNFIIDKLTNTDDPIESRPFIFEYNGESIIYMDANERNEVLYSRMSQQLNGDGVMTDEAIDAVEDAVYVISSQMEKNIGTGFSVIMRVDGNNAIIAKNGNILANQLRY